MKRVLGEPFDLDARGWTEGVTLIELLRLDVFPPAVAELQTHLGEWFPIFENTVKEQARACYESEFPCYLKIARSQTTSQRYVSDLFVVDTSQRECPCFRCVTLARLRAGDASTFGVDYFECPSCHYRMFTQPIRLPKDATLPAKARARIDYMRDALFFLDHEQKTATVVDVFTSRWTDSPPYLGVPSVLEPHRSSYEPDKLAGYQLRLMGHPFNGTAVYGVR